MSRELSTPEYALDAVIDECCRIFSATLEAELRAAWALGGRVNFVLEHAASFGLSRGRVIDKVALEMSQRGAGVDTYTLRRMARFRRAWTEEHLERTIARQLSWSKVRELLELAEKSGEDACEEVEEEIKLLSYKDSQPLISAATAEARRGDEGPGRGGHRRPSDPHRMFVRFRTHCEKLIGWGDDLLESLQDFYALEPEKRHEDVAEAFLRSLKETQGLIEEALKCLEADER